MKGANWYLATLRRGITPANEANTSRYVHKVLLDCLQWPFESILPQASRRGFIDYELELRNPPTRMRVEVKPFGATLREHQIRKYMVFPGRPTEDFRVGVLTNFERWEVYVAGPSVKNICGDSMVRVAEIPIDTQARIRQLHALIGHRGNGQFREMRAALAETDQVIGHLVANDAEMVKVVRRSLAKIRDTHGLDARVPHPERMRDFVVRLRALASDENDDSLDDCPFTLAKLRQAVCSREVAEAANTRLVNKFGARSRANSVRQTIARLFRG